MGHLWMTIKINIFAKILIHVYLTILKIESKNIWNTDNKLRNFKLTPTGELNLKTEDWEFNHFITY